MESNENDKNRSIPEAFEMLASVKYDSFGFKKIYTFDFLKTNNKEYQNGKRFSGT